MKTIYSMSLKMYMQNQEEQLSTKQKILLLILLDGARIVEGCKKKGEWYDLSFTVLIKCGRGKAESCHSTAGICHSAWNQRSFNAAGLLLSSTIKVLTCCIKQINILSTPLQLECYYPLTPPPQKKKKSLLYVINLPVPMTSLGQEFFHPPW